MCWYRWSMADGDVKAEAEWQQKAKPSYKRLASLSSAAWSWSRGLASIQELPKRRGEAMQFEERSGQQPDRQARGEQSSKSVQCDQDEVTGGGCLSSL